MTTTTFRLLVLPDGGKKGSTFACFCVRTWVCVCVCVCAEIYLEACKVFDLDGLRSDIERVFHLLRMQPIRNGERDFSAVLSQDFHRLVLT